MFKTQGWAFFFVSAFIIAALIWVWNAGLSNSSVSPGSRSLAQDLDEGDTNAFKAAGLQGIAFLVDAFQEKTLAEKAKPLFDKLPSSWAKWAPALSSEESWEERAERRQCAASILRSLGPTASPAVPAIVKVLEDPASDDQTRVQCAEVLGAIGPNARPALSDLLAAATNLDWMAQASAVALWKIDHNTNILIETISNRLRFAGRDRPAALPYFEQLGPALIPAIPEIERALYDRDELIRSEAETVLGEIAPRHLRHIIGESNRHASDLLSSQMENLASPNREQRMNALQAMAIFGPAVSNAVPLLVSIFDRVEAELPYTKAQVVTSWGTLAAVARERDACLSAVTEIGPAASAATPALIRLLDMRLAGPHTPLLPIGLPDPVAVCRALQRLGPGAASAVPKLKEFLANSLAPRRYRSSGPRFPGPLLPNPLYAVAAAAALSQISPGDSIAINALKMLQTNDSPQARLPAAVALWRLGLSTSLPLGELALQLEPPNDLRFKSYYIGSGDPSVGPWIVDLVGDIGPPASSFLPALEKHLIPLDPLRRNAAIAIRKIDPQRAAKLGLPGLLITLPRS
jgi:HEAT repeat protein